MSNKQLETELVDIELRLADALRRQAEIKNASKTVNKEIVTLRAQIADVVEDIETGQMRLPNEQK